MPRVSVVMPVYNGEAYVGAAVNSILSQTFTDFELIIVDDCSTDRTPEILHGYNDVRLRIYRHTQNQGVANALNTGWQEAHAEYIAIMHADDLSLPQRLEKQVCFLDTQPAIGIVGTNIDMINATGGIIRRYAMPQSAGLAGWEVHFSCPLVHASVMMRRSVLEATGGYRQQMWGVEDYDLWSRASAVTQIANLPDVLLHYRTWPGSITAQNLERMDQQSTQIVHAVVSKRLGSVVSLDAAAHLRCLVDQNQGKPPVSRADATETARLLLALYRWYRQHTSLNQKEAYEVSGSAVIKLLVLSKLSLRVAPEQIPGLFTRAFLLNPARVLRMVSREIMKTLQNTKNQAEL